jgi:hypothetical protein
MGAVGCQNRCARPLFFQGRTLLGSAECWYERNTGHTNRYGDEVAWSADLHIAPTAVAKNLWRGTLLLATSNGFRETAATDSRI